MNIIIVDDDQLVCMSLKTILQADGEIQVLATGGTGPEAVELYERYRPDILLMDIQMGGGNGLDAGEEILSRHPDARILFLTTFSDDEYIVKALRIGAKGYLIKQDIASIAPALEAVMSGQSVFGSEIVTRLPELMKKKQNVDLSAYAIGERELEVIRLVARGLSNKEIADEMYLSEGTVRNYLSTILDKLELRDRTQLAVFYLMGKSGILDK
ncbi:response regulator transcription factor [Qiania dongpingensis]|uniref:Stage 0 sporulation protein A homolog n=1 Tax=Qiania dongpingensis TaxID=2763669 RepID=A0A7G9G158_9FIRM|nr:response regulator transcription factor [Qiania dongpingensis]QNM04540.1 response regulator transcription factor [Qiania dongpingensis]